MEHSSGGPEEPLNGRSDREKLDWVQRITVDLQVCHGKPCIKGTRIWVSLVLDFLASGSSMDEILNEYPQLQRKDILACIAYGAEMSRERFIPIAMEGRP